MRAVSWLNSAVGVIGVACLLASQQAQVEDEAGEELVVRRLIIEDEEGNRRAELGVGESGSMLSFFDEEGKDELLVIGSGFGTPSLTLLGDRMGEERPSRISMGVAGPDTAIFVHDPGGGPRIQIGYTHGGPNVILIDERMTPIWRVPPVDGGPPAPDPDSKGSEEDRS